MLWSLILARLGKLNSESNKENRSFPLKTTHSAHFLGALWEIVDLEGVYLENDKYLVIINNISVIKAS